MATQTLPTSAATVRVVQSLVASDGAFAQQLHWVGDYDLTFLAKVQVTSLAAARFCRQSAGNLGLYNPSGL